MVKVFLDQWDKPRFNEVKQIEDFDVPKIEAEKKDPLKYNIPYQAYMAFDDFKEGFMDENLFSMMYENITNDKYQIIGDPEYNYLDDPQLQPFYSNIDYFSKSRSAAESSALVEKYWTEVQKERNGPAYLTGRIFGAFADPTSLLWFSPAAKLVFTGGRLNTTKKILQMESAQELAKHGMHADRTYQESIANIGGASLFGLVFGNGFGKTLSNLEKKKFINDFNDGFSMWEYMKGLQKNKIKVNNTATKTWRSNDGKNEITVIDNEVIKSQMKVNSNKSIDYKNRNWEQDEVEIEILDDGVININLSETLLQEAYKNKTYKTFVKDKWFKSYKDFREFVITKNFLKKYIQPNKNEIKIWKNGGKEAYEQRVSLRAAKQQNKYNDLWTVSNRKNANKDRETFIRNLSNERFVPTLLGKLGEGSNWNPVSRIVNKNNLTAINAINRMLHLPFIRKGNLEGKPTPFAIEEIMNMDRFALGDAMSEIIRQHKELSKRLKNSDELITLTDFRSRVSKALIDPTYKDMPEVMTAAAKARKFYDDWADEITESGIMTKNVEKNLNYLKDKVQKYRLESKAKDYNIANYSGKILQKTVRIRDKEFKISQVLKMINDQESYLNVLKQSIKRPNYLNIFVRRDKIEANEVGFNTFAYNSIKKSHTDLTDDEIFKIVESFKGSQGWEKLDRFEVNLNKSGDAKSIIDDYDLKIMTDPVGLSGYLKGRKLNIDYAEWMRAGWLEDDIFALMQVYNRSVGADVRIAQMFGDQTAMGGSGKTLGIADVIAEYKAAYRNAAGNKSKQKAIQKEAEETVKDLEAARDLLRGTYGVPTDPNRFFSRAVRVAKNYNALTMLQGATAALPDLARMIMTNGFGRSFRALLDVYTNKNWKTILKMSDQEGKLVGESWDILLGTRAMAYADLDDIYGVFNKFEKNLQKFTAASFIVNGMSIWNQYIKGQTGMLIQNRIIQESINWSKGTISPDNITKLAASGIDQRLAKKIARQYKKHGQGKDGKYNDLELQELKLSQSELWDDVEAQRAFRLATQRDINIAIVTPGKADTPLWLSTEAGSLIFQFKKFAFGSQNRMLIRGLQEKDGSFMAGIGSLIAMGMIVDMIGHKRFGRDYNKTPFQEKVLNGVDRSGVLGIFMDVNNSVERIMNNKVGFRPMIGAGKPYGSDSFDKVGAVLGPTVGTGEKLYKIFNDWMSGEHDYHTARNVRRLIPLQNVFYLDGIFDSFEKGIR